MAIFAVVAIPGFQASGLPAAIERHYSGRHHRVADGHWLVVDEGTALTVSTKLGIGGQAPTGDIAIVYNVAGYHGRAPTPVWEWLKANGSNTPIG
jgi:hypothetical protein